MTGPPARVLVLGGTTEGRALASAGVALPAVEVISSLAGRTTAPLLPPGRVRIGGFGGAEGLTRYLRDQRITAVIDATHPFAATMTAHAITATATAGVPLLVLRRPGWTGRPGDRWHRVPGLEAAAALLSARSEQLAVPGERARSAVLAERSAPAQRVFLTTGRQSIAAFAGLDTCWFLSRSVEPPEPPMPRRLEVLLDRGPFTLDGERDLLASHRIEVLVTKDSGGSTAKLDAARERGIPVIVVDRPPVPPGTATAPTVEAALEWLGRAGVAQAG